MNILSPQVKQIVLVDDDAEECFIFKTILHDLAPHITVTSLYDVDHVVEFLAQQVPDLLFLDMKLPRKSGIDCLRLLKSTPALAQLPVVLYTASARPEDVTNAYDLGAALYVVKPELYPEIVDTLRAVLSCNWQEAEAYKHVAHIEAFRIPRPEQTDLLVP
jgi:CheY-like chemotaxis protein